MASQGYEPLMAEVDRVVNSPYPTQLKQLHIVVTQKCSNADLLEWAASRPCQIDALARNLVQALQQWPYVLEIVTKFCVAKSIRDAFLQQEPTLLFRIVAQAVNGDWQHSTASIALLSHPLPQHITLPAASQNLFLGIVDHAAQQPSSSSIKPIYSLLKGGLAPLLGLLSHETLNQLERNFVTILRNTIEKQDQCLTLYCLAIMKAIVTASEEDPSFSAAGSHETQELLASTPNSPRWKPKSMQQYFSGSKAQKTLHLIALRVLLGSRETTEDTVDQTVECLRLANELIMFFPESTRESWCTENPIIVRKLQEKACQSGLNRKVQLSAFAFICSLCRSKNIPEQMVDQVAAMLSHPLNFTADLVTGHEPAMQWFVGVLNGVQLAETLISITSFTMHATPVDIIKYVGILVTTVQCLKRSLKTNESMVGGALTALGSAAVAQELTKLRQVFSVAPTIQPSGHGACDAAVLSSRKTLGNALCSLYLGAALAADHSQTDVSVELYPLLVETHAASIQNSSLCAHTATQARLQHKAPTLTAIDPFQPGTNWQHALGEHIQEKAKKDHSALSALFFNACADLERRCVDVEAPLHEEKRQRAELQHQYDNLYTEYTNLEDSKSRVQLRTDALQAEKDDYMHDLEHVREENEDLVSRIEELESKLRQNQDQTQKELEDLKRDFANAEMDHATNLARSEEHLEEVESRLSRLQSERDEEAKAKVQLESELANARSSKVALDADLDHWRTVDEEHKQVIASAERAKDELASRCSGLLADLEAVRQSAAQEKQAHEAHVAGMELELQRHTNELRTHHSNSLKHMEQTHQEALEQATAKLESIRDESRHAQADMEAQLQKSEKRISEYQKKLEQLKKVCSEKDDQIAEANAMRSNLMAAMGLGKTNQGSQFTRRKSTRSALSQSEVDTDASMPFIDILGAVRDTATQENATQDSNFGSSPKRTRSRKSCGSMAPPKLPRVSTASKTTRSSTQGRGAAARQPLAAISGNLSPSKDFRKTPKSRGSQDFGGGFDDSTFDGSEVFASTPGIRAKESEALPDDDTEMF